MIRFTLYSRSYCHLCDDMLAALETYRERLEFSVDLVDVDLDDALVEKYDELVPVLVLNKEEQDIEVCHYFLDRQRLETLTGLSTGT